MVGGMSSSATVLYDVDYCTSVGACCQPRRIPLYTEAVEANKKKPKNNPVPPWLRKKDNGRGLK